MFINTLWGRFRPGLSMALSGACCLGWLVLVGGAVAGDTVKVPEFSLEDQHQYTHHYRLPRPHISVLTVADRKGYPQIEAWVRALKARYGKKLDVDGVADVSIIPKPFHGLVRSGFKSRLSYPVMLDFGGQVIKALNQEKDKANIYVVQPDGQIVLHVAGMADATNLRRVFNALDNAYAAQLSARTADTAP